jgi:YD repeat-containing protein
VKIIPLVTVAIVTVMISPSCSKKQESAVVVVDACDLITEVSMYHPYDDPPMQPEASIKYDDEGRVKQVKGEGLNSATYEYHNDRIVLSATDVFGNDISVVYYLNNDGYITGTNGFDYRFTYNTQGYMVGYRQPWSDNDGNSGFTPYVLRYEDGNLVDISTGPGIQTPWSTKTTFTYYDEPNQDLMGYNQPLYLAGVLSDRNSFYLTRGGFFGKQSTELLKSMDRNQGGTPSDLSYIKDDKGRIIESQGGFGFKYACP